METITGYCNHCGKQKIVEDNSREKANFIVSCECSCEEGKEWRVEQLEIETRKKILTEAKRELNETKIQLYEKYNVAMSTECMDDILQSSAKIYDGEYETMSLSRGFIKAKISIGAKKLISINIKVTLTEKIEI